MKKRTLPFPSTAILFGAILAFAGCNGCNGCLGVQKECTTVVQDGKQVNEICYAPREVITNTTDYSADEEQALFDYLRDSVKLAPVDTCKCEQKLIRWGAERGRTIDIIGSVADAPKTGGPQGDSISALSPNFFVAIPMPRSALPSWWPFGKRIKGTKLDKISTPQRPEAPKSQPSVYVAVLDTGIDPLNDFFEKSAGFGAGPMCSARITDTPLGMDITRPVKPTPRDFIGHGTHVVGIVADAFNTSPTVNVRLLNVKVSDKNTSNIYLFDLLCGMYYALEKGGSNLSVINCSLGWEENKTPVVMLPLMRRIANSGILLVAGAGNNAVQDPNCSNASRRFWPAAFSVYPDSAISNAVLSVGAWDTTENKLWTGSNQCFEVAAPGVDITSLFPGRTVASSTGTSMAAGFASRRAAELRAAGMGLTPGALKAEIVKSAVELPAGINPDPARTIKVLRK